MLHACGFYALRRRMDARRGRRLLVLMYHDLRPDGARHATPDDGTPTASEFSAHMDTVARQFRLLSLADAARELREGGLREDTVAVTFDDGHAAVYHHALPILQRHGAPATLFVLTGWIEGMQFWWHRLRGMVSGMRIEDVHIAEVAEVLGVTLPEPNGDRPGPERFRAALARIAEDRLRDLPDDEREVIIESLAGVLGTTAAGSSSPAPALTWEQIQELSRHRVELAAHTHHHLNFRYASIDNARDDIVRSRDLIIERTGAPVVGFAYPYGKDLEHYHPFADVLRKEGFDYACTAAPGNNRNDVQLYSLRRISPPSTHSRPLIDRALSLAFVRDASYYDMRVR
jgi:peptidoglycan/xylan/chitin deacetylase (PgdA/CDA1 family)